MRIKSTFFAIALLFSGIAGYSQADVKDSAIFATMIYATYAYQVPQGDLAKRFGGNSSIGGGVMIKTKKNWLFGGEGNYIFGGTVRNSDSLMKGIETSEGFVIDENGYYSSLVFSERGFTVFGKFGKLFPVLSPNPNSGITILAGGGFMQDMIRIHNNDGDITAPLKGDYKKGYDRLNNGFALTGTLGYLFMSNTRLLNIYVGFDFTQAWTTSRRERDFDTGLKDTKKYSTQFYGFRVDWIIPLYKRKPQPYYLY